MIRQVVAPVAASALVVGASAFTWWGVAGIAIFCLLLIDLLRRVSRIDTRMDNFNTRLDATNTTLADLKARVQGDSTDGD